MPDEHDALISENQRLLKLSRRWRAVAIAALVLVFVVVMPFTLGIKEVIKYFSRRDDENVRIKKREDAMREQNAIMDSERKRLRGKIDQ
jgi:hypothetical protein